LNARIRKRWRQGGLPVGVIGGNIDLTYAAQNLGAGPQTLSEIADGTHSFARILEVAERPLIIVGQGALSREDGAAIHAMVLKIAERSGAISADWNGFNVLHTAAARVGGLDLGFVPGDGGRDVAGILDGAANGDIEFVYLLGADELDTSKLEKAFVVYQGTHGDAGAHVADVILPAATYTEKSALWVNTEGRVQMGRRAAFPPGDAREDWSILRALSDVLGKALPYDSLQQLRANLFEAHPHFAQLDVVTSASSVAGGAAGTVSDAPFAYAIEDFYFTNPIARASKTMAECAAAYGSKETGATGTNG